jgi:hypothetical protein
MWLGGLGFFTELSNRLEIARAAFRLNRTKRTDVTLGFARRKLWVI